MTVSTNRGNYAKLAYRGPKFYWPICQNDTMPNWHKIKTVIDNVALCAQSVSVAFKSFHHAILRPTGSQRILDNWRYTQNDFLLSASRARV